MKITTINIYKVTIPFRMTFSHSQKTARSVDNIVVEVLGPDKKQRGYGEGGPRPYVTGETQASSAQSISSLCASKWFPWDLSDVNQIWRFVDKVTRGDGGQNAAVCALETALLDALSREGNKNILEYLPKTNLNNDIRYGGTIPLADTAVVVMVSEVYSRLGIREVRLKMGRDVKHNEAALKCVRDTLGSACDLRVDVNGGWDLDLTIKHMALLESFGVNVLEQALPPRHSGWQYLESLQRTNGLKFMADESICTIQDMEKAIDETIFDMVNVRLSKCGGFRSSSRIIEMIRDAGLSFQVGCQLGESGILSAAGRALCAVCADAVYCDGSYDDLLLNENLTTENVKFGYGGKAAPLPGLGLGISVDRDNLERLSVPPLTITRP